MKTLIRGIVATLCAVALCAGTLTPAQAATKFRYTHHCAEFTPPDWGSPRLWIHPNAGRWHSTDDPRANPPLRCMDQFNTRYRTTVKGGFGVKVRWYVGTKLVRTNRSVMTTSRVQNGVGFSYANTRMRFSKGYWRINGKPVTAKVTFTKKGYQARTLRVTSFSYPSE
ncbi:MAG: hypothetical protein EOO74_06955 [Myxococcales bacterium]|nr:MAG: hypothetical protein EOO74_06955 [Myxococcales bacterium]